MYHTRHVVGLWYGFHNEYEHYFTSKDVDRNTVIVEERFFNQFMQRNHRSNIVNLTNLYGNYLDDFAVFSYASAFPTENN